MTSPPQFPRVSVCLVVFLLGISGCSSSPRNLPEAVDAPDTRKLATAENLPPYVDLAPILKDCYRADLDLPVKTGLKVNGHPLNSVQAKNIQWISRCVVPYLAGDQETRLTVAARTTWWALREGILSRQIDRAFRYANCHEKAAHGKKHGVDRGRTDFPLYVCPTNTWQVGLAAGQVMNYSEKELATNLDAITPSFDPKLNETALLKWTANLAGITEGTEVEHAILTSQGRLRRAWLMRNPVLAFPLVATQEVVIECLGKKTHGWCLEGNDDNDDAAKFSKTRTGMNRAISDLRKIFSERLAD